MHGTLEKSSYVGKTHNFVLNKKTPDDFIRSSCFSHAIIRINHALPISLIKSAVQYIRYSD